jgi:bacterioferritin
MKGDSKVIEHLNKALGNELVAINQYFLHAKMYKDWGLQKLAKWEYDESIEEMQHADKLIERILFLEGIPNLQDLGKLNIGQNVREMLECDLKIEHEGRADYIEAITYCEQVKDYVSRDLFRDILADEEDHIDHIETELGLIDKVGIENYMLKQMQMAGEEEPAAPSCPFPFTGALVAPVSRPGALERLLQLEARDRLALHLHQLGEHRKGPYPEAVLAVEGAVDHQRLFGLAVVGHAQHLVAVALVVGVDAGDGQGAGHGRLRRWCRG